jgi:hypothetical protein
MYSEKSRFPWSIFVVLAAVGVFGCIILAALLVPRLLNRNVQQANNPGATAAPPKGSVSVDISSSNTKEDWMNAMVEQFNQEQHKTSSGNLIFVRVTHVTSGGSQQAILDGKSQPTVWSPGDQSWIDGANPNRPSWTERASPPYGALVIKAGSMGRTRFGATAKGDH